MGRRLKGSVPVHSPQGTTWYGPGDEIPPEVAEKIGDHAWVEDEVEDQEDDDAEGPPPQSGKGSGVKAWAAYAASLGVDVGEDPTREDIIDVLRDAGHPVGDD